MATLELTKDDWVKDINSSLYACKNMNELLASLSLIIELRRFEGVFPYCVNAARSRAAELGGLGGVTTVVDGEGVLFKAGFANGQLSGTAERALGILRKIWKAALPVHFIVAFDDERRIRRERFPEYKSDRKPNARKEEIESIKPDVIKAVTENGIQVAIIEGYEADDVAASVSSQCQILDQECVVAASDKDCWQCLGPKTTIYSHSEDTFHGAQWLKANHKITPSQVTDWLVLVGKNGIKGADGIGPKIASDLLEAYGSFHDILGSNSLTPAKRSAIESIDYFRLKEIHSLNRTLPITRDKYKDA